MTVIYSALHLLVDGMCALAMFGRLLPGGDRGLSILVYNFCAFALQMPLGVALDALCVGKKGREADFPFLFVLAGVLCTMAGALLHPAVLGIGNALFHVGGGVGTIREDDRRSWRGRGLGVFVAPGALGLYLGTVLGRGGSWQMWAFGTGVLMALLCAGAIWGRKAHRFEVSGQKAHCFGMRGQKVCFFEVSGRKAHRFEVSGGEGGTERIPESGVRGRGTEADWRAEAQPSKSSPQKTEKQAAGNTGQGIRNTAIAAVCCILVVILRSYVGMAVAFPWKTGFRAGLLAVLMVVGGKAAGGFASARYGMRMTTTVSLGLAGICMCHTGAGWDLLSVLRCHAARAGRAVPVQYDHAHYPVLAGAQHAPDAGICLWAADICPVPGLPVYIFRGGCGSGRPCAGLCRQRAVHASADGGAGGGERGNWPYTVDRQDLQWRPRESIWLAVYSRVALQI